MWQADDPKAFTPWCHAPGCVTLYGKKQSAKIVKIDLQYGGFSELSRWAPCNPHEP